MVFCGAGLAGVFFASDKRGGTDGSDGAMSRAGGGAYAIQLMDRRETGGCFLGVLLGGRGSSDLCVL